MSDHDTARSLAAHIVASYTTGNKVTPAELPTLIHRVFEALTALADTSQTSSTAHPTPPESPRPAVPPAKSVFRDYIICLEDGKQFKMLKRHLDSAFGMTPEQYRAKWKLPPNYPMVAPAYARTRRDLALSSGLGTAGTKRHPAAKKAARKPRKVEVTAVA